MPNTFEPVRGFVVRGRDGAARPTQPIFVPQGFSAGWKVGAGEELAHALCVPVEPTDAMMMKARHAVAKLSQEHAFGPPANVDEFIRAVLTAALAPEGA